MARTSQILALAAALLASANAAAQGGAEAADAGVAVEQSDAGIAGPDLGTPFVPGAAPAAEPPDVKYEDDAKAAPAAADAPDDKPYAKGDMEPSLGFGFAGYDSAYFMMLGGSFAYYVANRFAPGNGNSMDSSSCGPSPSTTSVRTVFSPRAWIGTTTLDSSTTSARRGSAPSTTPSRS